jgi:hypothetical protein
MLAYDCFYLEYSILNSEGSKIPSIIFIYSQKQTYFMIFEEKSVEIVRALQGFINN